MRRKWALALALAVVVGWAGFALAAEYARPELLISTDELARLLGRPEVKVLDARNAEEYQAGHIPGALSLPARKTQYRERAVPGMLAPVEELEKLFGSLGIRPSDTIVLYDDTLGIWVARLFWTFDVLGHARVRVLNGGMSKWAKEGRPVSKSAPPLQASPYRARPDWSKFADAAYVLAKMRDPRVALVDSRTRREWSGEVASAGVRRGGHIPGAKNVDVNELLAAKDGVKVLKGADELAALFQRAGAAKDKEVIVYCVTGVRASHNYFALKLLGYARVRT